MGVLSADHVSVFLAVIDHGSFSAAARVLGRQQSAISYAIANLEQQLGVALFERSSGRPRLTSAGQSLLPDARRATFGLDTMRQRAASLARGVEAELTIVTDAFCPLDFLTETLREFAEKFPMVRPSIQVHLMHNAIAAVQESGVLALVSHPMSAREEFDQFPTRIFYDMGPVASPAHPLAQIEGPVHDEMHAHVQFVLGDQKGLSAGQEWGLFSRRTFEANDVRAALAMLLNGVCWGFVPLHLVADDLADGRLKRLSLAAWPEGGWARVPVIAVRHSEAAFGPAGAWLLERLTAPVA